MIFVGQFVVESCFCSGGVVGAVVVFVVVVFGVVVFGVVVVVGVVVVFENASEQDSEAK